MKQGVILAVVISLFMVGGASWKRLSGTTQTPSLVTIETATATPPTYDEIFADITNSTSTPALNSQPASSESLTGTDLIARQLMIDYINLNSVGQATGANLAALADQYVESIPTLNSFPRIGIHNLNTTTNSEQNFKLYSDKIGQIYLKYALDITSSPVKVDGDEVTLTSNHYSFMRMAAENYSAQAEEFKNVAVPAALAEKHLRLVNNSLASAAALKAAASTETDPASGFAGLVAVSQIVNEESLILQEIYEFLREEGAN